MTNHNKFIRQNISIFENTKNQLIDRVLYLAIK